MALAQVRFALDLLLSLFPSPSSRILVLINVYSVGLGCYSPRTLIWAHDILVVTTHKVDIGRQRKFLSQAFPS